jgi:recombination protein RecR
MIQAPNSRPGEISDAITECTKTILSCRDCGFFAEAELCAICNDPGRDRSVLCVVEQPTDILPLERTGAFQGIYHALGGKLSPLNHVGPEDLRFDALLERIQQAAPRELILALGADVEGEATASYLSQLLAGMPFRVTRLAQGLPACLSLESADDLTISRAFTGRTEFQR